MIGFNISAKITSIEISENDITFKDSNFIYLTPEASDFELNEVENKCTELGTEIELDSEKSKKTKFKKNFRFCYTKTPLIPEEAIDEEFNKAIKQIEKLIPSKKRVTIANLKKKLIAKWEPKVTCPKELTRKTVISSEGDDNSSSIDEVVYCQNESVFEDELCPKTHFLKFNGEFICVNPKCPSGFLETEKIRKDKASGCMKCTAGSLVYLNDIGKSLSLISDHWLCKTNLKNVKIIKEDETHSPSESENKSSTFMSEE